MGGVFPIRPSHSTRPPTTVFPGRRLDRDGTTTVGLYNPQTATFYLQNSNSPGSGDVVFTFGPPGDVWVPLAGNWNGSSHDHRRPLRSANGHLLLTEFQQRGSSDVVFSFGLPGTDWIPLAGDWNGDGTTSVGLYNPQTSVFYLKNSNTAGPPDVAFQFGAANSNWIPLAGSWGTSGQTTVGLYDPRGAIFYLRCSNAAGSADATFRYGPAGAGWTPIVGNWTGTGSDEVVSQAAATSAIDSAALPQSGVQPSAKSGSAAGRDVGVGDEHADPTLRVVTACHPALTACQMAATASEILTAGQNVTLEETTAIVAAAGSISLAYDTSSSWGSPTWIGVGSVVAADGSGSYSWSTTGIAAGSYDLGGYLWMRTRHTSSSSARRSSLVNFCRGNVGWVSAASPTTLMRVGCGVKKTHSTPGSPHSTKAWWGSLALDPPYTLWPTTPGKVNLPMHWQGQWHTMRPPLAAPGGGVIIDGNTISAMLSPWSCPHERLSAVARPLPGGAARHLATAGDAHGQRVVERAGGRRHAGAGGHGRGGVAARSARRAAADDRLPLMGVMGAFVFAAQMINFTLPGMPGTSGHLGGGVLLAILLGPAAGIVTMAAILIVQCLLFQDGGLLALGCNIINMGVIPCLLGWGLYRLCSARRPGRRRGGSTWRRGWPAWSASPPARRWSRSRRPPAACCKCRSPISQRDVGVHLVISLCEGAVTFAVMAYLRRARPELMGLEPATGAAAARPGLRGRHASLLATALLLAGVVSWFASTLPEGLEWSYSKIATARRSRRSRTFAGGCRGRSMADEVVADARLQPPRGSAGPVARRRTERGQGRLAQFSGWGRGRSAGHDRHPGRSLRPVALDAKNGF